MSEEQPIRENLSPSVLTSIKIVFVEWMSNTTAHALPNISRTSHLVLKIIWLVCFLACFGVCLYSVIKNFTEYFQYNTALTSTVIPEIPTKFPAVTICSLKTINKAVAGSYLATLPVLNPFSYRDFIEYTMAKDSFYRVQFTVDTASNDTLRRMMGYELKDILLSCMFNFQYCDYRNFTYFYDTMNGNCYTFNSDQSNPLTVSTTGPNYGLLLEFFLGNPDIETMYEFHDGVLVSVHNQSSAPFSDGGRIIASTNAETDIILSRTISTKLGGLYGNCLKDTSESSKFSSTYFDYIVKTLKLKYSYKYCYQLCMQEVIINTCGCSNAYFPVFSNPQYCNSITTGLCMQNVLYTFGSNSAKDKCNTGCPFECDTISFETNTFRALYPTKLYKFYILNNTNTILQSNINYDDIDIAVARVNIYYKGLEYTYIEEQATTSVETLFSNIGGTLGLYIGISILSLAEVFEIGFNLIIAFLTYFKSRKQNVTVPLNTLNSKSNVLNMDSLNPLN